MGFCPARVSVWSSPESVNMFHPVGPGGWSKTEHTVQSEPGSYSESFAKNVGERQEELLLPPCHQEGQACIWKWNQSVRKPAWEPWIQLCLMVASPLNFAIKKVSILYFHLCCFELDFHLYQRVLMEKMTPHVSYFFLDNNFNVNLNLKLSISWYHHC